MVVYCVFFFQAEDGIRDHCVTGVQTCALPILDYLILSHEVGHALYMGQERSKVDRNFNFNNSLEEAAAYLFSFNSAREVMKENPELGKQLYYTLDFFRVNNLNKFSQGDLEQHAFGMAIAESLDEEYGYNDAFNKLLTISDLSEIPPRVIDKLEIMYGNKLPEEKSNTINDLTDIFKKTYCAISQEF